ncbi:uncharacterized protein KGF55_001880 [Candida pseudojiufengensis]|uniref:uncharacterized protein n=1 Tax=Candida pseudojiufengensis TaxID=497109 RepID=UPI0022255716|nr:uncharacterized protein KGF55_001880 [Candida pseudojiufengensis]KAI5964810.1 hypothetical protein KGF55_001880 [Candida pseudojiufengensis]
MRLPQLYNKFRFNQISQHVTTASIIRFKSIALRNFATQVDIKNYNQLSSSRLERDMQMFTTKQIIDDDVYNVFEKTQGLSNSPESIYWTGEELDYNELPNGVQFDFFVRDLKTVKQYFENKPYAGITTGCLIDKLIDVIESNQEDGKVQTIFKKDFDVFPFIRLVNCLPSVWDLHCQSTKMLDEWCKLNPVIDPLEMKVKREHIGDVTYKEKFFYKRSR